MATRTISTEVAITGGAVRCGGCGRLLGRLDGEIFLNKLGKQVIRAALPVEIQCPKCAALTQCGGVEAGNYRALSTARHSGQTLTPR